MHGAGIFETVDRGDVRMIEGGEHLGFALETREAIGVERQGLREDLHGDVAIQRAIMCAIDLAHPALSNRAGNFVRAKASADGESHRPTSV